jgi:acyl-CoA thioester hydrolase
MARMGAAGFALVARRHQIEYKQPAVLDDELEVSTWIAEVRRTSAIRHYTITRLSDGALLARCRTYWVWIDPQIGRPIRVPDAFMTDFASNIA